MNTHTHTHLYLAQCINAASRCHLPLHQKHSSASPLSLQSGCCANNNVVLDSADPSDSKTRGTLRALIRQNLHPVQKQKGQSRLSHSAKICNTRNYFKFAGNFSALAQMTKNLDFLLITRNTRSWGESASKVFLSSLIQSRFVSHLLYLCFSEICFTATDGQWSNTSAGSNLRSM